jgi:hypothetical protein
MMIEKRRGITTRAKANGSVVSSFRSPIQVTLSFDVSVLILSIKHSSFNPLMRRMFCPILFLILQ